MKIDRVTFTGADDKTDIHQLRGMSEEFPYVEWGILFSKNNHRPRFPKFSWIESLAKLYLGPPVPLLSAHFCGQYVRDLLAGDFKSLDQEWAENFSRIQVNFHGEKVTDPQAEAFLGKLPLHDQRYQWILQMDGVNDQLYWAAKVQNIRAFPLFDLSGGEGVLPDKWPVPIGDYCGYAGGLGPHNLESQLQKIAAVVNSDDPIWIDFETHVRNDKDQFDLERVRRCLEIAEPYIVERTH